MIANILFKLLDKEQELVNMMSRNIDNIPVCEKAMRKLKVICFIDEKIVRKLWLFIAKHKYSAGES